MFEGRNHKKRKFCEKCSNEELLEDRISKLPEELICFHILSRLRTIDAVRTSVLSTKWRNLWKRVPHLALHSRKFSKCNDFVTFMNKFLDYPKDSVMRKFQLRIFARGFSNFIWLDGLYNGLHTGLYTDDCESYVTQWIDEVLTRHKIQHLDFSFGNPFGNCIRIPPSLYTCETIVHLRLVGVTMVDSKFVFLPCLRSIYLKNVRYPEVTNLEKLISSSPVLEDLTILKDPTFKYDVELLRMQSQTLERIYIDSLSSPIQEVVIDAPLLRCLKIKLNLYYMTRAIYSGISPKVPVHVKFEAGNFKVEPYNISLVRDNLTNISTIVSDLVINRNALKFISLFFNVESLPQFGCLSCLSVNLFVTELKWFPTFLESCPNLKSLSMEWQASSKKKKYIMPKCLLSSLECVDIKTTVSEDAIEVKVVKYFLDNAVILKKLTLHLDSHPRKKDIFKKILKFPRRSIASQLLLL